jgi:hypothetical protein
MVNRNHPSRCPLAPTRTPDHSCRARKEGGSAGLHTFTAGSPEVGPTMPDRHAAGHDRPSSGEETKSVCHHEAARQRVPKFVTGTPRCMHVKPHMSHVKLHMSQRLANPQSPTHEIGTSRTARLGKSAEPSASDVRDGPTESICHQKTNPWQSHGRQF